ncbi:MAG TPA: amidohydrolase family protein [Solirubrobacteraceae bacterium]|nr:amidohydrolase family protein [Solirubrobacteraceae bacterium]
MSLRIIAVEEHAFPRDLAAAAGVDLGPRAARVADALDDLGEGRLAIMDEAGIDVQVLSGGLGGVLQGLEAHRAVECCRALNDRLAAAVTAHPNRFRALATLPMCSPEDAAQELRRSVEELGHVGAMIHGQTHGVFLDDPSVRPVLAEAERLDVPIYLHPAPPPPAVREAYFSGLSPAIALGLATAGWGWHAECGMHVLRMVVAGVFQRFPGLQVIVGHMGENLPFSLVRSDEMMRQALDAGSDGVAQTVLRHVHISTCGYHTEPPLRCALSVFGPERIMFSVDHPFGDSRSAADFLRDVPLEREVREDIAHRNAERLLRL